MALTYVAIATTTVESGGAADIEFTSIPATYTDLLVKLSARGTRALTYEVIKIEFNGSTANLSSRQLYGDGSAAGSSSSGTQIVFDTNAANNTASVFGSHEIYIPNYAGSTNKSVSVNSVMEQNGTTAYPELVAGLWADTSAITSIKLLPAVANFAQYSTATLYGIKNS